MAKLSAEDEVLLKRLKTHSVELIRYTTEIMELDNAEAVTCLTMAIDCLILNYAKDETLSKVMRLAVAKMVIDREI